MFIFLLLLNFPLHAMETFTVEADRIALPYERTTSTSVVLTEDDLAGKATLNEALQEVSGLTIAENGPYGGTSTYFLRGYGRGQVKVFIDGIEIVDPSDIDRSMQLQHFPLAGVEKIEVVKGVQGALYGADASGGVILITTKDEGRSTVRGGIASHETWSGGFSTQAKQGDLRIQASGDVISSEGISAYNETRVNGSAEDDFYKRNALRVALAHLPSKLKLSVQGVKAKQDIDNSFSGDVVNNDLSKYDHMIYTLSGEQSLLKGEWILKESIAHTKVIRDVQNKRFEGETNQVHVEGKWLASPVSSVVVFSDYSRDTVTAATEFSDKSQESMAIGATHYLSLGKMFADQSLRVDKSQAYAARGSGRFGIGYNINRELTLRTQVGSGFKTPTLYQRFTSFGGSEELKATRTKSVQTSATLNLEANFLELSAFYTEADNQVDYDQTTSSYKNLGETESYGLEWNSKHQIENFTIVTNYTWMRARNSITKADLPRRPRWFGSFKVSYYFDAHWSMRASHQAVSKRDDSGKMPYFDLVSTGVTWNRDKYAAIDFDLFNAFDRDYEIVRTYGTLGRTFRLQFRWGL